MLVFYGVKNALSSTMIYISFKSLFHGATEILSMNYNLVCFKKIKK